MFKRALFILTALVALLPNVVSAAKVTVSVTQIVEHPALDAVRKGFMDNMKALGIDAGYNVHIAQGNAATNTQIASQIAGEKPDLILAIATPSAQAVAQKIKDIPIIFTAITDPKAAGLVQDMAKPGANATGMTDMSPVDRQLALIKDLLPKAKKLGVIYNAGEANSVSLLAAVKAEAAKLGWTVEEATAANSGAVFPAAKSLVGKVDAIYIPTDNTVVSAFESIVKVCTENKLPLFAADTDSVKRGAIAAVAIDYYRMGKQSAEMAKRILGGAKPAEMPVETLKDLEIFVNPKAAKAMGVTLPEALVKKADKVVE